MSASKLTVRQDMPPKAGYGPVHWKRYAPKRTIPGYFLFTAYAGLGIYCYYKAMLLRFEERVYDAQLNHIKTQMMPFLHAEEDRRMVRARKQHEEDLKLIMGPDSDWDMHRRTLVTEDHFVPYSSREMRVLLTDDERVALGGSPSRYSRNDLWENYMWQLDSSNDKIQKYRERYNTDLNDFSLDWDE